MVVVIVILLTGILISASTWIFLQGNEHSNYIDGVSWDLRPNGDCSWGIVVLQSIFVKQYYKFTGTLDTSAHFHLDRMFEAMRDMSETISLKANKENQSFPFVTHGYFESRARRDRLESGFHAIRW